MKNKIYDKACSNFICGKRNCCLHYIYNKVDPMRVKFVKRNSEPHCDWISK